MRVRNIAFALESLTNLNYADKDTFERLENVVLAKKDDLIPYYTIKILQSYLKIGMGSPNLYD